MLYKTNNQEIINLYSIYNDLNIIINELQQAKEYLLTSNITKKTKTYTVFINDKPNYANWNKVYKTVFYDMINNNLLQKIIMAYQLITSQYYLNLENNKLYKYKNIQSITTFKQFEYHHKTLIFNGGIFIKLKKMLKKLLISKLTNKNILEN
jgi:hypothetical protein